MTAVACRGRAPLLPRPFRRWSSVPTSWMLSRRIVPATTAWLLAGLLPAWSWG